MAVNVTYNINIGDLYQAFYTKRQIDLLESLAWLTANEKSYGTSEEQLTLIVFLAHFYFEMLPVIRTINTPGWTYLDWLTQEEYDTIMNKREVLGY